MSTNQPGDHPARKPAQSGGTKKQDTKTSESQVNPATPARGPRTPPGTMPKKPGRLEPVQASSDSRQDQNRDDSTKEPARRPGQLPSSKPRKERKEGRPGEGARPDSSGKSYEGETGESGEVDSRDEDHDAK